MTGLDIRTVIDTGVNATDEQLRSTLPPSDPGFDPDRNFDEALQGATSESPDAEEMEVTRRKVLKSLTTTIPSGLVPISQEFAQATTPVFKEWLGIGGWTQTVLHCVAEGHIVRKWTSTDNYMTIDLHITAIALPLKRWWDDNMGPFGSAPVDKARSEWAKLLEEARWRARLMGNSYLRLELKEHKEGPQQVIRLTGAGVCSHVRVAGPLTGDHGFFECHPDRLLPINPPRGPSTGGPRGPSAAVPTGSIPGGPREPTAPSPTGRNRVPWLPLYNVRL